MSAATAFKAVIPARYASSRLPGKPLADIAGSPMVVHVARRAQESGAGEVVVATDDARVQSAVAAHGIVVEMTDPAHPSGTDRIAEVALRRGWPDDTVVVNVQGDEPLIAPGSYRAWPRSCRRVTPTSPPPRTRCMTSRSSWTRTWSRWSATSAATR